MQKKIEWIFKVIVVATFFTPLAFFPRDFIFPFIVPKILIFRSLAIILLGLYIILLLSDWERYKIRFTPLTIVVLLFLASFTTSTFLGLDWYRSFWDNHERMLGLFTVAHYVIYYFVLTAVIRTWDEWKWLLRAFLLAGGIVMGIAFIQQFNHEFLLNTSGSRSASTLGNPIYVGGYGLFLAATGAWLAIKEKLKFWKIFAVLVGFSGFLGVFFSGSRGALLGLVAGIGVLIISYIINLKEHKKLRLSLVAFVLGIIVLTGILFIFRENRFISEIPTVGRLLNSSIGTVSTRIMAWDIAVESWKDYPIIGWGPSNYYFAFNQYYRPEFLEHGYRETWFDNAHNIVLNTLTERGILGVIIYLGIFAVAIVFLWKKEDEKGDRKADLHFLSIASAFLIAHLVQTVSVFDNPTSYLYFFFFLAFINRVILGAMKEGRDLDKKDKPVSMPIALTSVLFMMLFIYSANINPARANMATLDVLRGVYSYRDDIRELYQTAIAIPTPHIDDIRNDVARTVNSALRGYVQAGKSALARDLFRLTFEELEKNKELHPLDLRIHAQEVLLLQEATTLSGDRALLLEAEKIMADALSKSPKRQQFIYTLAGIKIQLNKLNEAESLYLQAIADDEIVGESWWRLALLKSAFGDIQEAVDIINEAREKGINFGGDGDPVVAEILEKYGRGNSNP